MNAKNCNKKYKLKEWAVLSDDCVLYLLHTGEVYQVNTTGKEVIQQISKGKSPEEIAKDLSEKYGVPLSIAYEDVKNYLEYLSRIDALEESL